jgi:hypothetical protein
MTNGSVNLRDMDDKKEFAATNEAFGVMGLTSEEIKAVWGVVSAVLLFGDVEVLGGRRGGEQASITSDVVSQRLCALLGINHADFIRSMTKPRVRWVGKGSGSNECPIPVLHCVVCTAPLTCLSPNRSRQATSTSRNSRPKSRWTLRWKP